MLLLRSRTAWDHYFPETNITYLVSKQYTLNQTHSNTDVYVLNSLFDSIASTSNGGALSCTSVTFYLLSQPLSSLVTQAVYVEEPFTLNTNSGQCVLYGVCGYDCCSTNSIIHVTCLHS